MPFYQILSPRQSFNMSNTWFMTKHLQTDNFPTSLSCTLCLVIILILLDAGQFLYSVFSPTLSVFRKVKEVFADSFLLEKKMLQQISKERKNCTSSDTGKF